MTPEEIDALANATAKKVASGISAFLWGAAIALVLMLALDHFLGV